MLKAMPSVVIAEPKPATTARSTARTGSMAKARARAAPAQRGRVICSTRSLKPPRHKITVKSSQSAPAKSGANSKSVAMPGTASRSSNSTDFAFLFPKDGLSSRVRPGQTLLSAMGATECALRCVVKTVWGQ